MKYIVMILLVGILIILSLPVEVVSYTAPVELQKPTIKEYAKQRVNEVFGEEQWKYVDYIVSKESNWTVYGAHYPVSKKSSAHGLCGFLNSTWKGEKTDDPYIQIDECLVYIKERYGDAHKAYHFHLEHNWY